jgi:predicted Zn-ribbon and HTH transcriptional regulator
MKKYLFTEIITNTYIVEAKDEKEAEEKLQNWDIISETSDKEIGCEEMEENNFALCVACQNSFKTDDLNSSGLCEGCQSQDRE